MTTVSSTDLAHVTDAASLFSQGYARDKVPRLGVEAEFFATRQGVIADGVGCQHLAEVLKQRGYTPHFEFAGIVEYAGDPFKIEDIGQLTQASATAYQVFSEVLSAHNYKLEDTSHLPALTESAAIAAMGPNPRAEAGLASMRANAPLGCRLLPLMNASVQVSLSVHDDDDLFRLTALAYRLTPFLYAYMSNHPATFNGENCATHHVRGKLYDAYGLAGGISQAFCRSANAQEFVANHIAQAKHTPMFFSFSDDGKQMLIPHDGLPTFDTLPEAQQTASNLRLAQSFAYHDVKICDIRGKDDRVTGKRIEVRAADTGHENMMAMPVFCALALRTPAVSADVERLLGDFGFSGPPVEYAQDLRMARQRAVYHNGQYARVAFGRLATGKAGQMVDFARELGVILRSGVQQQPEPVQQALEPLLKRCADGISRSQELACS
jgi:hypothetical protein